VRLSLEQIIQFQTEGYLVAENVLTEDDLAPIIAEISKIIDERANRLKAEGKIVDLCEELPFERRYAALYAQCSEIGRGFDIMQLRGEEMFRFLLNDNLLDIVECLLGSELMCNPIQHIRAKLPSKHMGSTPDHFQNVPWHQDAGVTLEEADDSEIITFWLPLVDATEETGCMEVMPGAFKRGHLKHQAEGGTTIVHEQLPEVKPTAAPCRKGGIVIMNKFTPHRGTSNRSDIVRWSLDLRYHKTGAASGRPFHPSFVARSRSHPETVLRDHSTWCDLWTAALDNSTGNKMHRV
jgi:phytanoyl-CoA hydroxylase